MTQLLGSRKIKRPLAVAVCAPLAVAGLTVATATAAQASTYPSCTGSTYWSTYSGDGTAQQYGWYWNKSGEVCVGSVVFYETDDDNTGRLARTRVWEGDTLIYQTYAGGSGAGTGSLTFDTTIRQLFPYSSVEVCSAVVYSNDEGEVDSEVPVVCQTLPT